MAEIGEISRSGLQFQQKSAHRRNAYAEFFAALRGTCQRLGAHNRVLCPFALCPVRDPHSYRSVPFAGQPVPFSDICAKICRSFLIALAIVRHKIELFCIEIINKGTKTCSRKLGSSQQQQHSASLVAWKQIYNALPLVARLVRSPLIRLGSTKQLQPLRALLQLCFATTRASAAQRAKTFRAQAARLIEMNSRQGFALAAVLRSKDPEYV